jgi:hypothetical protein
MSSCEWRQEGGSALPVEGEGPSTFVDHVVVAMAQGCQVGEIRRTEAEPVEEVVDLAPVERNGAPRRDTGAMGGPERAPLGSGGDASGASFIERHGGPTHHDRG